MDNVHYSTNSNEWETPKELYDLLNGRYGPFTLDPCATKANAKCSKFYTKNNDGLRKSWADEVVFMNPPYGREIGRWIEKAYRESRSGVQRIVCLIPARTDTTYWHNYIMKASEILFVRGRIRFVGGKYPAPFPSAVIIFDSRKDLIVSTLEY